MLCTTAINNSNTVFLSSNWVLVGPWSDRAVGTYPVGRTLDRSASESRVLGFVDGLVAAVERTDDDPACIVNAARALTGILAARACTTGSEAVHGVVARPDVFVHLSALLRAQFPRPTDKATIFRNVCRMLAPVVHKVRPVSQLR